MFKNFRKIKYNSGISLVELLVVISIFFIISTIVLFSYGKSSSATSIQNLADDIALTIRKAQSYAIGVRGIDSGNFSGAYGIHFRGSNGADQYSGSDKSFILFVNLDGNNKYDYNKNNPICGSPVSGNECLEILNILSSNSIKTISLFSSNRKKIIGASASLDVFFKRPNPEPTFCYHFSANNNSCRLLNNEEISHVVIKIVNDNDSSSFKNITIWNNGQISVS